MRHAKKPLLPLFVAAAALALAACGGGGDGGAETVDGSFGAVAAAPAAYANVGGEAALTRSGGETELKVELAGLEPETEYLAHLHSEGCAGPEPGGPSFQFEKGGSEGAPNEIGLEFESDASGAGEATARSDREVPKGEAGSVVVRLAGKELACAPLEGEAAEGSGEEKEANTDAGAAVPTIRFENGEPVGGVEKIEAGAGERVRFKVHSDVAEEVHVHGYDLMKDVPAGGTIEFDFPAEIEGIFEAEMEGVGVQILELRVNP